MAKDMFKYMSELAVSMFLEKYHLIQFEDLEEFSKSQNVFSDNVPFHIYFVLSRSRVSLDENFLQVNKDIVKLKYHVHDGERKTIQELEFKCPIETTDLKLESEYPFSVGRLVNREGRKLTFKLSVLIDLINRDYRDGINDLDYEILYIGQSYGKDGNRNALDRLVAHSTLQKIYSNTLSRNPDKEIFLMLAKFEELNLGHINGRVVIPKENQEMDSERLLDFMNPEISNFSESQKINFTEAALISAFKPKYNKEYKASFPSEYHSSYKECYELEINGIVVEMDTSEIGRWMYTQLKPRKKDGDMGFYYYQFGTFDFVNSNDRYKIFNNDYLKCD